MNAEPGDYELDSKVPDLDRLQARYARLSESAAGLPGARLDLAYGSDPRQRLDVFPPAGGAAPLLVFFHGGYWRAGSKESRRFPAPAWCARGVAWVTVEYRLAPAVTLTEIVADARAAIAWLYREGPALGCDPGRIHVTGNSASGHLVGMLAAHGWQADCGVPADVVASATPVSGLFDLAPLRATFVNEWLRLDAAAARRNSPSQCPPRAGLPMVVAWGGDETPAFKHQAHRYVEQVVPRALALECEGANHFTLIADFGDPDSALFRALERLIGDV